MERLAREVSQPEQLGALVDASYEATVQLGDQPIDMAQLRFCPSQRYPPMTGVSRRWMSARLLPLSANNSWRSASSSDRK